MPLFRKSTLCIVLCLMLVACGDQSTSGSSEGASSAAQSAAVASSEVIASLSVQLVQPRREEWASNLAAFGAVAPWQESVISAEVSGLRLIKVLVNVGDKVRKGQPLAILRSENLQSEVDIATASLKEAKAVLADAQANAERGQQLRQSGFISAQELQRLNTLEKSALARVDSLKAQLSSTQLRLAQSRVLSPDDGVISARQAVAGMMSQPGQELFRLIVQSRLEWRAQVPAAELSKISVGGVAAMSAPGTLPVHGRVRSVSPSVDTATRQGTVFVDLPIVEASKAGLLAGMFASGNFELSPSQVLTVPQSAVLLRDGFAWVFEVDRNKVRQRKVSLGKSSSDRIAIVQGIDEGTQLVLSGVGFLVDGDTVRVVQGPSAVLAPQP